MTSEVLVVHQSADILHKLRHLDQAVPTRRELGADEVAAHDVGAHLHGHVILLSAGAQDADAPLEGGLQRLHAVLAAQLLRVESRTTDDQLAALGCRRHQWGGLGEQARVLGLQIDGLVQLGYL